MDICLLNILFIDWITFEHWFVGIENFCVLFQIKLFEIQMKMSTHEDDDQDQDQEINVDSDSRLSCGSGSDIDMDGTGSCYDSETALG